MFRLLLILVLLIAATGALGQPRPVRDWVRDGVIYEIYPRAFSQPGNFNAITARLPEGHDEIYIGSVGEKKYLRGLLDEVRIYDRAVPLAEIRRIFEAEGRNLRNE